MAEAARNHEFDAGSERFHSVPRTPGPMSPPIPGGTQPGLTLEVMHRLGISAGEVWLHYLGMGGELDEWEVDAYLHGILEPVALDRDMVSQTVNELFDDLVRSPRAPYSWQCGATITATDEGG